MPEVDFDLAVAFGIQSARGTADSTIEGLSGSLVETDGIVLGDRGSGIGETGIGFRELRRFTEKANASGSFTKQFSDFLERRVDLFEVTIPFKGNGVTSTPTAGQAKPVKGVDAMILSGGFVGANGTSPTYDYTAADAQIVTAKMWYAGLAYILMDLISTWTLTAPPGEIALWKGVYSGKVSTANGYPKADAFPTFNYGNQATLSAPVVQTTGHNWGIGSEVRSFASMEITGSNEIEEVGDSEAVGGRRIVQNGRTILERAVIALSSTDLDHAQTELARTSAPTDDTDFRVGAAAAATDTINAWHIFGTNPELRSLAPFKYGDKAAWEMELAWSDQTPDGEITLTFD